VARVRGRSVEHFAKLTVQIRGVNRRTHQTPYGDEVEFADGRIIATGNWHLNETDFAGYVSLGSLCGVDVREILLKIQRRTEKKQAETLLCE
jgi:hypothetical protein